MKELLFVVEEAHFVTNPHFIPHWFKKIITAGRSKNIGCYFTSVRPGLLNGLLINQSSVFLIGNLGDRNDSKALANYVPGVDQAFTLRPRQFLLSDGFSSSLIHS